MNKWDYQKHAEYLQDDSIIAYAKKHLKYVKLNDLLSAIKEFRKIDLQKISDQELSYAIASTISVNVNGKRVAFLMPSIGIYPKKTRFYRVRRFETVEDSLPLKSITNIQDVWAPPSECIKKRGRLNKQNEPVLYTSVSQPITAIVEMKVPQDELFCLITYEAKEDLRICVIDKWKSDPRLNSEENCKMRLISNFLYNEFTKKVSDGEEYLYRASEMIAKVCFQIDNRSVQDAFCYPSIAWNRSSNVCFQPETSKELLGFVGFQVVKYIKSDDDAWIMNVQAIVSGFSENGAPIYNQIESPIFKEKFPEINLRPNP